ncbi:MAG: hypothetical protein HY719_04700 [Planctomycetes bacterium]|nr:hypothetical protein [Planctomycetota bacterium]
MRAPFFALAFGSLLLWFSLGDPLAPVRSRPLGGAPDEDASSLFGSLAAAALGVGNLSTVLGVLRTRMPEIAGDVPRLLARARVLHVALMPVFDLFTVLHVRAASATTGALVAALALIAVLSAQGVVLLLWRRESPGRRAALHAQEALAASLLVLLAAGHVGV